MNLLFFLQALPLPHLALLPPDLLLNLFAGVGALPFPTLDWITKGLKGSATHLIDASIGDDQMQSFKKILSLKGTDGSAVSWDTFWDIVNKGVTVVKPFGYALVTTYFLLYLFDAASKEQLTFESVVKVLIQLIIVVGILANLEKVINVILSFAESIYHYISSGSTMSDGKGTNGAVDADDVVDGMFDGKNDLGTALSTLLTAILVWIIHQLAVIALDFAAIVRMIELGWRIVFTPVGIANCFEGGASSPAVKYAKGVLAVALSGAVLYVIGLVGFSVVGSILSSDHTKTGLILADAALLGTAGAAIGASNKVKEITT